LNNQWLKFKHLLQARLFPQACLLCLASDDHGLGKDLGICQHCLKDLPHHGPACPQCGLLSIQGQLCGACIASPPDFDATIAAFTYQYPISQVLQQYKYNQQLFLAETFAELILQKIQPQKIEPQKIQPRNIDLIIPMPLHPSRLQERGFNQSLEIARIIGKRCNIPINSQAVSRIKYSPPQASLPLKERVKNMKGAFSCHADLSGLRIALIDDVMTTGASLNALAKACKAKGAAHVECWLIARTLAK
jgi:ComF family protein